MENKQKTNGFAVAGFVLGILSALSISELLWGIPSILAIIFSAIALHQIKTTGHKGKSIAFAGLILGILFTAHFGIKVFLRYTPVIVNNSSTYQEVQENNTKDKFIGTWQRSQDAGTIVTSESLTLFENYFVDTNYIHQENGEITGFWEFTGNVIFSNDSVTLYVNNYTEGSDMPPVNLWLGKTRTLSYKNNKLIHSNGLELEKIK